VVQNAMSGYVYCRSIAGPEGQLVDILILEANQAFVEMFGLTGENINGKPFSQVFKGMHRVQTYLTNALQQASSGQPLRLRVYFRPQQRFYHMQIYSPQTDHYMIELVDASLVNDQNAEYHLKRQLSNDELLLDIAMLTMQNIKMDQFYHRCLEVIGEKLGLSRVHVFAYRADNNTIDNTYEWVAPGIPSQKGHLQGIPTISMLDWHQTLMKKKHIQISNVEDMPGGWSKQFLRSQGVKSFLAMPLFIDSSYVGFLGFNNCLHQYDWQLEDIHLLSSIRDIFADYMKHKQTEAALNLERAQLLSLFDSIQEPIYVADMENYSIIYANLAMQRAYDNQNLLGEICYRVLMNQEQPCEHCTNPALKAIAYEPYVWEFYNPVLNRYYRIVDRMITWPDGRDVRFEMAIDISDYKQATRELQTEKERLRVTLHSIGDGVISTNRVGIVVMMNEVAENLTGWWREEALGRPLNKVFRIFDEHTYQPQPVQLGQAVQSLTSQGTPVNHAILLDRNGIERPIDYSASPIKDISDNILGAVLVFRDVTEQKKEAAEIFYLSYHDRLTGLFNRAFFERELARLNNARQLPLSLIMGDVNGLKITNDVFGHQAGDRLLRTIANLLKQSCRAEDIIARWGGDEFIILLPQTSSEQAKQICERITKACRETSIGPTQVSISLGYATKDSPEQDIMQVLRLAEEFMYKRKLLESKSVHSSMVGSIKQSLYERGVESEQHTQRLAFLVTRIGHAMGLLDNEINDLQLLAMFHDLGKIAISDHILKESAQLSPEEARELKRHTEIGYRIAQSVPELAPIAECILSHHEWWNGQGYPQGLKGAAIPLLSRIIAIADAYDKLITGSSTQPAMQPQEALKTIAAAAGTQFDPDITAVFLRQMGN